MRLVLDTSVLVAAIRSDRGASRRLPNAALDDRLAILLLVPLALEYEAVLTRPENLVASGLGADDVTSLIDVLVAVSTPVELSFTWRPITPDPDDDMVVETAVNGSADAIVSFNVADLLSASSQFGVKVMTPAAVLRMMEQDNEP